MAKRKNKRPSRPVAILLQGLEDTGLKKRLINYEESMPYKVARTDILRRALHELLQREGF
jgi:hypothetical protein